MKGLLRYLLISILFSTCTPAAAESDQNPVAFTTEQYTLSDSSASQDPVKIELLQEEESIQPGRPFWVVIRFDIEKGWHSYWKNPGDSGMPASIEWKLPEGFTVSELHWPAPHRFELGPSVGFGYEDEMLLLAQVTPPEKIANKKVDLSAEVRWLVCSDSTCLPGSTDVTATIQVDAAAPQITNADPFKRARSGLPSKLGRIQAEKKKDGLIEVVVELPTDHTTSYTKAFFFPEDSFIDPKADPFFTAAKNNHYTLTLKDIEPDSEHQALKGVLVLMNQDKEAQPLEINIPIKNTLPQEESIGLVKNPLQSPSATIETAPGSDFEGGFFMALLFAFVGGMILNLMPCVLPVISLKIFSFVKMAGQDRSLTLKHGLAFAAGVILSFWTLAGALLGLQAYGNAVGWGFQLQEPIFVAILAAIIFVLGLSLFGLMEIGTGLTSLAGNISHKQEGLTSSFLSGILATAVATPCTGPFLGSAVGFAVTLPPLLSLVIFTMLGVGMAFPYVLLSAYPSLLRFIPKPGNWMITFKEIMGFLMMATTIWLLWVFSAQTNSMAVTILLGSFFFLALSSWIYGKWGSPMRKKATRYMSYVFAIGFLLLALYALKASTSQEVAAMGGSSQTQNIAEEWEPFSPERVAELRKQGIPVFVDFTAKWCLICQANHVVLTTDDVSEKFRDRKVVRMKADWTKSDPVITAELKKFGRNSVPLYVLYGAEETEQPKILPQVLTPDLVMNHLNDIADTK